MVVGPSGNSDGDSVRGGADDGDQIVFHLVKLASECQPCRQDQEYPAHRTDAYTGTHQPPADPIIFSRQWVFVFYEQRMVGCRGCQLGKTD